MRYHLYCTAEQAASQPAQRAVCNQKWGSTACRLLEAFFFCLPQE
jgi:hypothetical protein